MKILAVEDNPADVEILRELLDPQGSAFELQNVKTLAAAWGVLSKGETEFILIDLGLPDSQGIATLREVRARYPSHPIVVLTGFDDEETGMHALHEGAQDYLVKGHITGPFLVRSIRYAYERNRIEQELVRKNIALDAMNEELTATGEELRQNLDELGKRERELQKSEEHLARSQEIAHLGSWELNLLNNRLSWSDEVYRIFGLRPQEFGATYEAFLEAVHPDDRAAVNAAYTGSLQNGKDSYEIEHRVVRKDNGEVRYVHEKCDHIRDKTNRVVLSVGMVHDITDRRQMEMENIRARKEWERTFNTVPDLIAIIDMNHRVVRANKAMASRLGTTQDGCIGLVCHEVVHYSPVPPDFCPHSLTCCDGKEHVAEVREDRLGGDFIVSTTPLYDESGSLNGSVHVARDITDRKKAEQELRQKNEKLNTAYEDLSAIHEELRQANDELLNNNLQLTALNQELTAAKEELHRNVKELGKSERELKRSEANLKEALAEKEILLSEIHHRVKNNLAAFISLISLEGSGEDTPAGRMLRQDLQNRARSMALIHETLYRTNTFDKVNMEMYLTTLIDQIAKSFKTKRYVKTSVNAEGIMFDIHRASPAGLIINELVTNSFKYAFPESFDSVAVRNAPPEISIDLSRNDGIYTLIVRDNGVGLPPGIDPSKTQTLGLKLVNFLAKHQMHAKIEVNAANGTEFVFRLKE